MLQGTVKRKEDAASTDKTDKVSNAPTISITPTKTGPELDAELLSKAETTVEKLEIVHSALIDDVVAHDPNAKKAKGIFLRANSGKNLQILNSVGTDAHNLHGELAPPHHRVIDEEQGIWRVESLDEAVERTTKNKNKS